jgi:hypothetical protein
VFAQQSPTWNLDFSLDELEAALKTAEAESKAAQDLNTAPPRIIYRDHPALLVSMDGDPVLREIENSSYEAVINTPYPLIFDGKHYYLNAAKGVWYRAGKATGPYQFEASPPADIAAMVNAGEPGAEDEQAVEPITAANAPEIVVSTEAAELIVTEGPAAFVPLVDDLLVLQNSDDDVFMHVNSQKFYIVLAGRWYRASSLNGPWAYQPADDLPAAFANIPRDSDQADSRVYVAGTEEARDAVLDAQVPQTAAVARGEVDIDVEYDGEPIYEPVDGTDLVYIENTGSTVIQSDGWYYLVEDGVWYVSSSPNGPWQVSDHRPAQVDTILPTSPVYNVKYVRVYDSTPSMVYVGYTPGYTGSYVYYNTIFYGSGWNYSPWVSPYYYYPRHSTWGFNVSYNPWYGWNFGLSWGWGPFSVGYYTGGYWHNDHYWHHRYYGGWGPRGYRPRHYGRHGYGRNRYVHNDSGRYGDGRGGDGRGGDGRGGDGRGGDGRGGDGRGGDGRGGDGRGGDGRRGDGGFSSGAYQRNTNLYRDDSQRARIADTRDNQPRIPGRRNGDTRQVNDTPAQGGRERNYAGQNGAGNKKADRNRIDPVPPSDMSLKASLRDANNEARRSRLIADNSGNVYRGADRRPDRNDVIGRSDLSAKGGKNRTTPVPRNNRPDVKQNVGRSSEERKVRHSAQSTADLKSRREQTQPRENKAGQRSSQVTTASSRQSQARATYKRAPQRSSRAVDAPAQLPQARTSSNSAGQRPSQAVVAPVRLPQPRSSSNRAGQRSSQAVSAPTQKQTSSRPGPQPGYSGNSGRNNSAPAQRAPQRSAQRTGSQRHGSSGGGGRSGGSRSGGSRSKRS